MPEVAVALPVTFPVKLPVTSPVTSELIVPDTVRLFPIVILPLKLQHLKHEGELLVL